MSENLKQVVGDQLLHFIQEEEYVGAGTKMRGEFPPIRRVPSDLLEGHEKYYIPRTVSIGPFHAHNLSQSSADEQKRAYLKRFVSSFPQGTTVEKLIQKLEEKSVGDSIDQQLKAFLKDFVSRFSQGTTVEQLAQEMKKSEEDISVPYNVKKGFFRNFLSRFSGNQTAKESIIHHLVGREADARDYYEGQISLSSYEFLKIMLLDGCFIIEWLLLDDWRTMETDDATILLYNYQQDLLKVENQIPFFILSDLYNSCISASENQSLVESALSFFGVTIGQKLRTPNIPGAEIKHLLHLVIVAWFPLPSDAVVGMPNTNRSPSLRSKKRGARELELAYGVKFKTLRNVPLSQIEFRNGVLGIPQLGFEESTLPLFSNLLVSELYPTSGPGNLFSSYVVFMDSLISDDKDVEVLLRSEILKTRTNDVSELVSFFNGLSTNLRKYTPRNKYSHFEQLHEEVNNYCKSGLLPLRGYWVNTFYESRWEILNNFLLFVLTVTQTLFSILGYSPSRKEK